MSKFKTQIYVSPLTVFYVALALILGRFSFIFFHFLFSFIHELSHVLAAKSLKKEVKEIAFLPIGFFAQIDEIEESKPWQQILILSAGPLSYFISFALLSLLYETRLISIYGYDMAKEANLMILIFNLIPLVPLDGGRILKALLLKIMPYHRAYKVSLLVSSLIGIGVLYLCVINKQCLVLGFLIFDLLVEILLSKKRYLAFLFKRLKKENDYPYHIHSKLGIFTFKNNLKIEKGEIKKEKLLVEEEIKRVMKKKGI